MKEDTSNVGAGMKEYVVYATEVLSLRAVVQGLSEDDVRKRLENGAAVEWKDRCNEMTIEEVVVLE